MPLTSGTIAIVSYPQDGKPQATILTGYPVTAGVYCPIPVYLGKSGGMFTTASGASGLLLV